MKSVPSVESQAGECKRTINPDYFSIFPGFGLEIEPGFFHLCFLSDANISILNKGKQADKDKETPYHVPLVLRERSHWTQRWQQLIRL
jgi:hypothetical protein